MKKLFTLFMITSLAFTMQAQHVTTSLGANGDFIITDESDVNLMTLDRNGDLKLGGNSGYESVRLLNLVKEEGSAGMTLTSYIGSAISSRSRIDFSKANGSIAAPSSLTNGDEVGALYFYGRDDKSFEQDASIEVFVDGAVTTGNVPMSINFFTGASSIPRLKIKNDGKVGIGITTPTSTLDVKGSLSLSYNVVNTNYSAGDNDYTIIGASPCTVTLPAASTCPGRVYLIKRFTNLGNVIIDSAGGAIDASSSITLDNDFEFIKLQSEGFVWVIIGGKY